MTVVKFANGVEVWLKPTDFKNDQMLFTMYAPGGASLAPPADFLQARFATQYVGLSGVGGIKAHRPREAARRQPAPRPRRSSPCRATASTVRRRRPTSKRRCSCSI